MQIHRGTQHVHDGQTTNKEGYDNDQKAQWRGYNETDPKRVFSLTERAIAFIEHHGGPSFCSRRTTHWPNIVYREESYTEIGRRLKTWAYRQRLCGVGRRYLYSHWTVVGGLQSTRFKRQYLFHHHFRQRRYARVAAAS